MDIASFQTSLEHWGYLLLFFASFGGGYTAIVAAGVFCALGKLDINLSLLISFIGNCIGSSLLAYLARMQKKDFTRLLQKHRRKLALTHVYMQRYGIWLIFFSKFIYGIKTIVPLGIGLSHYSLKKFIFYNIPACGVFTLSIGLVSFFASNWVLELFSKIEKIESWKIILILFVFLALIFMGIQALSKKKH